MPSDEAKVPHPEIIPEGLGEDLFGEKIEMMNLPNTINASSVNNEEAIASQDRLPILPMATLDDIIMGLSDFANSGIQAGFRPHLFMPFQFRHKTNPQQSGDTK